MKERLVVPTTSLHCKGGDHASCAARELIGRELYVCVCGCHDRGEPAKDDKTKTIRDWAAALGRKGGKKGGTARAKALTPEKRRDIALLAASIRWGRSREFVGAVRERLKR